jgi:vitamin B12 transporter
MGRSGAKPSYILFLLLSLFLIIYNSPAFAQSEEEKNFLLMYFKEEELSVVSATRSLKPISRVAENMTVITADDIERMNAHTLAEVLNTITGLQVQFSPPTPGNLAFASIQGSNQKYVTVLLDGVVMNNLSSNFADIGVMPVQQIERIEIIKGPASSSWGSALGGVINIITKSASEKGLHGTVSGSYGSNNTEDYRMELSGRTGNLGLYLSAGGLHTNGFSPSSNVFNNSLYSKLTYAVLPSTDLRASLFYLTSRRHTGDFSSFDLIEHDKNEQYFGTISLTSRLTNDITLDVGAWAKRENRTVVDDIISTGDNYYSFVFDDRMYNTNARVAWKLSDQTVVAGAEYNNWSEKSNALIDEKQRLSKWAVFINDTITWGNLAVTPGVRFEDTSISGNFVSPSLGATYQLTRKSIVRLNVARGFYIPALSDRFGSSAGFLLPNPDIKVEKVWSYQAGAETGELKYVWLKASFFRHDISDIIDSTGALSVNKGKQRFQGVEAELKTMTVYNAWLSAGATFIDALDVDTNQTLTTTPRYVYDIALNYDDKKSFKAMLKGRYIWWNANSGYNGKYSSFIFDISMAKTLYRNNMQSAEIFATGHNLFNDNQYYTYIYPNPRRWAEIGLRVKF